MCRHFLLTGWGQVEEFGRRSVRGHERRCCSGHEWAVRWWTKWRLPPERPSAPPCCQGSPVEKTSHACHEKGTPWRLTVKPSNKIQRHGRRFKLSYILSTNLTIYLIIHHLTRLFIIYWCIYSHMLFIYLFINSLIYLLFINAFIHLFNLFYSSIHSFIYYLLMYLFTYLINLFIQFIHSFITY